MAVFAGYALARSTENSKPLSLQIANLAFRLWSLPTLVQKYDKNEGDPFILFCTNS